MKSDSKALKSIVVQNSASFPGFFPYVYLLTTFRN